jgi:catechol 2,3-dioxygenase-like lactoylglutathione lyase family enzyme
MINGIHTMIFAEDAEKARAFLRDVLNLEHVDAGGGWLIFALPPAEMGVHPVEDGQPPHQRLYLMCDDIEQTVADLRKRGVEFVGDVEDQGWGLMIMLRVPGAGDIGLYQPQHPSPLKRVK